MHHVWVISFPSTLIYWINKKQRWQEPIPAASSWRKKNKLQICALTVHHTRLESFSFFSISIDPYLFIWTSKKKMHTIPVRHGKLNPVFLLAYFICGFAPAEHQTVHWRIPLPKFTQTGIQWSWVEWCKRTSKSFLHRKFDPVLLFFQPIQRCNHSLYTPLN
jgi:hypothetical protein